MGIMTSKNKLKSVACMQKHSCDI